MVDKFRVGVITGTHGLKGEVKVFPTTDDPDRYETLEDVILVGGKEEVPLKIDRVRYFKQYVIVGFEGLNRIEDVEHFVRKELYVTRENAAPLKEGEYYIPDLIGLAVTDDEGLIKGKVKDVLQTGANDVYIVEYDKGEVLIPSIPDCILDIDIENGKMLVHLLPGLLDL